MLFDWLESCPSYDWALSLSARRRLAASGRWLLVRVLLLEFDGYLFFVALLVEVIDALRAVDLILI